jgi:hypothetical protein
MTETDQQRFTLDRDAAMLFLGDASRFHDTGHVGHHGNINDMDEDEGPHCTDAPIPPVGACYSWQSDDDGELTRRIVASAFRQAVILDRASTSAVDLPGVTPDPEWLPALAFEFIPEGDTQAGYEWRLSVPAVEAWVTGGFCFMSALGRGRAPRLRSLELTGQALAMAVLREAVAEGNRLARVLPVTWDAAAAAGK